MTRFNLYVNDEEKLSTCSLDEMKFAIENQLCWYVCDENPNEIIENPKNKELFDYARDCLLDFLKGFESTGNLISVSKVINSKKITIKKEEIKEMKTVYNVQNSYDDLDEANMTEDELFNYLDDIENHLDEESIFCSQDAQASEEDFNSHIDDEYGDIWIYDECYEAHNVLKELDEYNYDNQYDCWKQEQLASAIEIIKSTIKQSKNGDKLFFFCDCLEVTKIEVDIKEENNLNLTEEKKIFSNFYENRASSWNFNLANKKVAFLHTNLGFYVGNVEPIFSDKSRAVNKIMNMHGGMCTDVTTQKKYFLYRIAEDETFDIFYRMINSNLDEFEAFDRYYMDGWESFGVIPKDIGAVSMIPEHTIDIQYNGNALVTMDETGYIDIYLEDGRIFSFYAHKVTE